MSNDRDDELKNLARDFLRTPARISEMIEVLRVQRSELAAQSIYGSCHYDDIRVSSSAWSSPTERVAVTVADIDECILRLEAERNSAMQGIEHVLHYLPENERMTISSLFIDGRTVSDVAEEMGYEPCTIYKYLRNGLLKTGTAVEAAAAELSEN